MLDRLFVYGTLMPGQVRWPTLEPYALGSPEPDTVSGRLLDTGAGYPALVDPGIDLTVRGWVVALEPTRAVDALRVMDCIEGTDAGLFVRAITVTVSGRRCWVYRYLRETADLVDLGGRWPPEQLLSSVDPDQ